MMRGMVIDMEEARLQTIEQVRAFLDGATEIAFRVPKAERYRFIERVLKRFGYASHGRVGKGVLLRYLVRLTGLSRQQVTRLVRQYHAEGTLSTRHGPPQHGFRRRFTATDVALLADMDALHDTVSGPATKKLMERAFLVFKDARFERLAGISVSPLYNLRGGTQYQRTRRHWTKTRPTGVPIGQRRAPPTERSAGLYPYRQRASGRPRRGERRVSHQCRGLRDAVPAGRHLREDQRGLSAAGHPPTVGRVSVCDPGISCGQRLRGHQ